MLQRARLPIVALAIASVLVLAWTGIGGTPFGGFMAITTSVLLLAALLALIGPTVVGIARRRSNVYDLQELKRLHEKRELEAIEEEHHTEGLETVYCPHCGRVYSAVFKICPNCRQ